MSMKQLALDFFHACDSGKGWETCKQWCHDGATFSAQADALADITTLQGYTEWTKGLLDPLPDAHYELKSFAVDEDRGNVTVAAVFHGTHTVDAGTGAQNQTYDQDMERRPLPEAAWLGINVPGTPKSNCSKSLDCAECPLLVRSRHCALLKTATSLELQARCILTLEY